MKLMPSPTASWMSRAASASVLPVFRPSRLKPPVPSPATLTLRPVRPRVVWCIAESFLWLDLDESVIMNSAIMLFCKCYFLMHTEFAARIKMIGSIRY